MKKIVTSLLLVASFLPVSALALDKNDDCYATVTELAKGVANASKQFQKTSARIVELDLTSATEVRNYSLTVQEAGCLNSFDIQLSNDSASKCVIEHVKATGYCN